MPFFTVLSTVGQFLGAKLRNLAKRRANEFALASLRKTSCATQRKHTQLVRLELQISRSEPTELCRRFPIRKPF